MLLASCVSIPTPDPAYLKDCSISYLPDGQVTNGDLLKLSIEREFDVKRCNLDKAALRAWFEAQCAGPLRKCVSAEDRTKGKN